MKVIRSEEVDPMVVTTTALIEADTETLVVSEDRASVFTVLDRILLFLCEVKQKLLWLQSKISSHKKYRSRI